MQVIMEGELCPALRQPPCDGALTVAERSWLPLPEDACERAVAAGGWCVAEPDGVPDLEAST